MGFWGFLFLIIAIGWLLSSIRHERARNELVYILAEQKAEQLRNQQMEELANAPLSQNTIIFLTELVVTAFIQAAQKRSETIPNSILLNIAGKMVLIYQVHGDKVFASQLQSKLDQYLEHGLQESDMKDYLQLTEDEDVDQLLNL